MEEQVTSVWRGGLQGRVHVGFRCPCTGNVLVYLTGPSVSLVSSLFVTVSLGYYVIFRQKVLNKRN